MTDAERDQIARAMTNDDCVNHLREMARTMYWDDYPQGLEAVLRGAAALEDRKDNAGITYVDAATFDALMED